MAMTMHPFEEVDTAAALILGAAEAVDGRDAGFIGVIAGLLVNANAELFAHVGIGAGEVAELIAEEARRDRGMIARDAIAAAHTTKLAPAAALIRAGQVVDLAAFRRATAYKAICPECHAVKVVHGRATARPPLCDCDARMVALA